jgi:multiple sugar transport system ATP-binding protein
MAAITFEDVTKRFDDGTVAVDGLNLDVADGELVILVGPSGCGKSTALRMLAGLEEVTDGRILLDGDDVTKRSPSDRDIAMVFQNYALYPHMTVAQNMSFALRLRKMSKADVRAKVVETARALELEPLLDRKPGQLSGGQRQRVAMGRAIVRDPKAFLMDEPLSNLDAKLRVEMRGEVARLKRRLGATMLYVTHDQVEAMTLGDRVVVLRGGQLQQQGAPQDLYARPANAFVATFLGSPAMNLVPARRDGAGLSLPFGDGLSGGGTTVLAGFRPHDVALTGAGEPDAFAARVDVVEALGSESFAYVTVPAGDVPAVDLDLDAITRPRDGELRLCVRLDRAHHVTPGQTLTLRVDPDALHLFDAADGRRLEG